MAALGRLPRSSGVAVAHGVPHGAWVRVGLQLLLAVHVDDLSNLVAPCVTAVVSLVLGRRVAALGAGGSGLLPSFSGRWMGARRQQLSLPRGSPPPIGLPCCPLVLLRSVSLLSAYLPQPHPVQPAQSFGSGKGSVYPSLTKCRKAATCLRPSLREAHRAARSATMARCTASAMRSACARGSFTPSSFRACSSCLGMRPRWVAPTGKPATAAVAEPGGGAGRELSALPSVSSALSVSPFLCRSPNGSKSVMLQVGCFSSISL